MGFHQTEIFPFLDYRKGSFSGGEVASTMNPADSSVVEFARIKLFIPKAALADGAEAYKFYIGPNDYQEIGKVTEGFTQNVYLGGLRYTGSTNS
jgi:YidC/Oxa1 family membrane protein insertase